MYGKCCKQSFGSAHEANMAMRRLNEQKNRAGRYANAKGHGHAYFCKEHGAWHFSSERKDKSARMRREANRAFNGNKLVLGNV